MLRANRQTFTSFAAGIFTAGAVGLGAYSLTSSASTAGVAIGASQQSSVQLDSKQKKEVVQALDHLKQARDLLKDADHDEKGHDHKALEYTKQAISEFRNAST